MILRRLFVLVLTVRAPETGMAQNRAKLDNTMRNEVGYQADEP